MPYLSPFDDGGGGTAGGSVTTAFPDLNATYLGERKKN